MGQPSFWLVYEKEVVTPMEYIVPSLRIVVAISMAGHEALEERIVELEELEEE